MKKAVLFVIVGFALLFSTSCVKNTSEYKKLQAERDSLVNINTKNAAEMEDILSLMNEVDDNFSNIKSAENYLSVQSNAPSELAPSAKDRIRTDMKFVTETLELNRKKIAELEKKLKNSSVKSTQLQQTVNKLRQELEEKTAALVTMNQELEKRNQQIAELSANVNNLSRDVQNLKQQSNEQQQTINRQQQEITKVYYCFGTSSELKKQNILVNNQLGPNFNREYFIAVNDYNQLQTIQLKAKSGKLISRHPDGSYRFVKDANNQVELRILDPANFWSLTKYLVVLVTV